MAAPICFVPTTSGFAEGRSDLFSFYHMFLERSIAPLLGSQNQHLPDAAAGGFSERLIAEALINESGFPVRSNGHPTPRLNGDSARRTEPSWRAIGRQPENEVFRNRPNLCTQDTRWLQGPWSGISRIVAAQVTRNERGSTPAHLKRRLSKRKQLLIR